MKIKTSEATPLQLDWLVAKIKRLDIVIIPESRAQHKHIEYRDEATGWDFRPYSPSTDRDQGGAIVEEEAIATMHVEYPRPFQYAWAADKYSGQQARQDEEGWEHYSFGVSSVSYGPTLLIAGMRCYVAAERGDEVEVPDELL